MRTTNGMDAVNGGAEEKAVAGPAAAAAPVTAAPKAWLPDGYSRILRLYCVWPFGLLDYGSATLRCKI